jgi:hypothetical protein
VFFIINATEKITSNSVAMAATHIGAKNKFSQKPNPGSKVIILVAR